MCKWLFWGKKSFQDSRTSLQGLCPLHIKHPTRSRTSFSFPASPMGEDWQFDFNWLPACQGYKYLLVFVDTFPGWIEAYPVWMEKAMRVVKALKEVVPWFVIPRSLQSYNSTSFTSQFTQLVSRALGISYFRLSSRHPQHSGMVDRINQTLKQTLEKLCQKTSKPWPELLCIALLRLRNIPTSNLQLSSFELLCGRSFLHFPVGYWNLPTH